MKRFILFCNWIVFCCSSQEEHVLKHGTETKLQVLWLLLLARGACIETAAKDEATVIVPLLLARGACIETNARAVHMRAVVSCSSQEEHVLKPFVL